jgi:NADH dehydrogenase
MKSKIIVIGGGFAGIEIVKRLDAENYDILLIDKINHHQFQPLFYQVAAAQLDPSSISFPLRSVFKNKKHVQIRLAEVLSIDENNYKIHTSIGDFTYDYLIISTGCETNYFGNNEIRKNAFSLKSVYDAILIRNHILQIFEQIISAREEEKESLLNLVIVGAGPTGVELAGAFAEIKKNILLELYPGVDFSKLKITLIEGTRNTLNNMSFEARLNSRKYLIEMGVAVLTETFVNKYDGEILSLKNGKFIKTKTVIWAAGVIGNQIEGLGDQRFTTNKRIKVNRLNQVVGSNHMYAVGDIAYMETYKYPKGHPQLANVAIGQAKNLANNLKRQIKGNKPIEYEYQDFGSMATIGKFKAVVDFPFMKLKGYFAWIIWMFLHLMLILSVRNKLIIFINWVWAYTTKDPSLHLIFSSMKNSKINTTEEIHFEKVHLKSLSSMLNHLTTLGYETQFQVTDRGLYSMKSKKTYQSNEIEVVRYFRFEGESDPDDNEIVYAILTHDGEKGTLVDAYGIYNDGKITDFMRSVTID